MMDKVITMISTIPGHQSTHALIQPSLPAHLLEIKVIFVLMKLMIIVMMVIISERIFMNQSVAT